ncbi:MAG: hypothetical protein WC879_09835 [Melioribacteraceae bacterium]
MTHLKDYFIKKIIIGVDHKPNFLHTEKARKSLNNFIEKYNHASVKKIGAEESYEIKNEHEYWKFFAEWNHFGFEMENSLDFESAESTCKTFLSHYSNDIGISIYSRVGIRVIFLFPFNGTFEELLKFYNNNMYKNVEIYNSFGDIDDAGIIVLTAHDKKYKMNLSFGPFAKGEIKSKISDFKNYDEKFDNSFMVDIDLFQDKPQKYVLNTYISETLNAARVKVLKFKSTLKE